MVVKAEKNPHGLRPLSWYSSMGGRLWYKYYCEKKKRRKKYYCVLFSESVSPLTTRCSPLAIRFPPLPSGVLPLPSGFSSCHQVFPFAIRFSPLPSGVLPLPSFKKKKKILLPFAIWFFPLTIQSSPHALSFPPAPPAIRFSPLAIRCCDPVVTWMPTLFV